MTDGNDRYGPKAPWRITRERFWEMLEVLPPCRWERHHHAETFHVSELLSGNIAAHFVRLGSDYYELQADHRTPHAELVRQCLALDDAEEQRRAQA